MRHRWADRTDLVEEAVAAMTVLHATDVPTVYLSLLARVDGLAVADVDDALYRRRSLVRHMAMRRTLFGFPRDLLPAALGGPSARVAGAERRRLVKEVEAAGLTDDGAAWLAGAAEDVLACLADGTPRTATQVKAEVPAVAGGYQYATDKAYGGTVPVAPRVLTVLALEGHLVRAHNDAHWRINRPTWTTTRTWLGEQPAPIDADRGWAELVRRWLWTFGPGTLADLVWWTGATKTIVRQALADVAAVEVSLDSGATGYLLPDDLAPVTHDEPSVALLPVLDPTPMGWQDRSFFLGDRMADYFDSTGNAGTTAWVDGRVVGCWVQDPHGTVRVHLVEPVSRAARSALDAEATRITDWCAGERVSPIWVSPLMKAAAANG